LFFVKIRRKPASGVGCHSPLFNLDFWHFKKFKLEENRMAILMDVKIGDGVSGKKLKKKYYVNVSW
jgi:hypothetical protein